MPLHRATVANRRDASLLIWRRPEGSTLSAPRLIPKGAETTPQIPERAKRLPQHGVRSFRGRDEREEWQHQYYQGKSVKDFNGLGCGIYLLGSPLVASQSPIDGKMRFEIMSGTEGAGSGSIRLCAPEDYWPSEPSPLGKPIFLIPFAHIGSVSEQVIVIRNPSSRVPKTQTYQIIIVPTAATGSSPIMRKYPEIISFNWPDKKADKHLSISSVELAKSDKETYLSVFNNVVDEQLAPFGKSVLNMTIQAENGHTFHCSATLCFMLKGEGEESNIQGNVHFLDTGLLFLSKVVSLYLSFESLEDTIVVLAKDNGRHGEEPRPVSLEVYANTSEPFYKNSKNAPKSDVNEDEQQEPTLLGFKRLPVDFLGKVKAYASSHAIKFRDCEQLYYNFAENRPLTGWQPAKP